MSVQRENVRMEWTRSALLASLEQDTPASKACRDALSAGAWFQMSRTESTEVSELVTIYERRSRHLAKREIKTLGFKEAIERLRAHDSAVSVAAVHSKQWDFVIFLDASHPTTVACLAVDASAGNADWFDSAAAR